MRNPLPQKKAIMEPMNKDFVLLYDMNELDKSLTKKQRESMVSDILLKKGLGVSSYSLYYGSHGKPYLKDHPDIFFSISHSGHFAACAFSASEIGLDLQEVPGTDSTKLLRIAKRFFSERDYRELSAAPSDLLPGRFTDMWAAHEAYVKYTGEGLGVVKEFSTVDGKIFRDGEAKAEYRFLDGPVGYRMVICENSIIKDACQSFRVGRLI